MGGGLLEKMEGPGSSPVPTPIDCIYIYEFKIIKYVKF